MTQDGQVKRLRREAEEGGRKKEVVRMYSRKDTQEADGNK